MMEIPCEGASRIHGDNQSVLQKSETHEATLNKKNQQIIYCLFYEGVNNEEWRNTCSSAHDNEVDLVTKVLLLRKKRKGFAMREIHHLYGERLFSFLF